MEQVRAILAWMAKYHFWLLSVLVVLISVAVWYMAAGDLTQRKAANISKINQAFSGQQQIRSRPYHANEEVNRKQREQIVSLASETEQIWQALYERQRKDVLKWPKELPAAFRNFIDDKQFGDEIPVNYREQYRDYITRSFENLPKIINANEIDEDTTGGGRGFSRGGRRGGGEFGGAFSGGMAQELDEFGNPIEVDYTVYWSPEDQARIREELTWPTTQSHWRIWVTQEDLWVYETMLRAIAATNEAKGSDRFSNAAISQIAALQVGRDAAEHSRTSGRITRLEVATRGGGDGEFGDRLATPGAGADFEGGGRGEFGGRERFGEGGGDALGPAVEKALRLSGRYIDAEGAPVDVAADELPLTPDAFGQEMKRLPVRLVVNMDARWLAMLMAKLANADLQIKVTEVRVGDVEEGNAGVSGGRGGRGEFGGRSGFSGGFGNEEVQVFDREPYKKPVIIQGVVLIFNPPNGEILEVEAGEVDPGV